MLPEEGEFKVEEVKMYQIVYRDAKISMTGLVVSEEGARAILKKLASRAYAFMHMVCVYPYIHTFWR
jgi:hypothetical protein